MVNTSKEFHANTKRCLMACVCVLALTACGGGDGTKVTVATQLSIAPAITSTWAGGPAVTMIATQNGNSPIVWGIASGPGAVSSSGSQLTYSPDPLFNTPNAVTSISASSGNVSAGAVVYVNFRSTSRFNFAGTGGVAEDQAGNIYVSDAGNNVIRKMTRAGIVTTFAGNGNAALVDGPAAAASFNQPAGLAFLPNGNLVVADRKNNAIRLIHQDGSVVTVAGQALAGYADRAGSGAMFGEPNAVATDKAGNIYVADADNHVIRLIDTSGNVSTFAGTGAPGYSDGPRSSSQFYSPHGIVSDQSGNLFVADSGNNAVREISSNGIVTTLAGGDASTSPAPKFDFPTGIALTGHGLVIADTGNAQVQLLNADGSVTAISGQLKTTGDQDGSQAQSSLSFPFAVANSSLGDILVVDAMNNEIRSVDQEGGEWITRTNAGFAGISGDLNGTALPR
ncbi:NHL repeat-containing protein [Paraburkholderia heleia]|uniref:hypothetical protein n=1 Tax=Paraburkholderia heleia TaxID=634127 RepID=UPI002AB65F5E|nr:hypothetical protein [Paraburkholderia heleia]